MDYKKIDHKKESVLHFIEVMGVNKTADLIIGIMDAHDGLLKNYEELIKLWQAENKMFNSWINK